MRPQPTRRTRPTRDDSAPLLPEGKEENCSSSFQPLQQLNNNLRIGGLGSMADIPAIHSTSCLVNPSVGRNSAPACLRARFCCATPHMLAPAHDPAGAPG